MHPAPLLGFLGALLLVARWSVKFNLPAALPADAPMELFSEARALAHARALADDIGVRVVGTAGVEAAERYVAAAARDLASRARATRPDLDVDFLTHRPTGSFRLNFLNHDIANAYTNLPNVAVRVRARTAAGKTRKETRSVLLNAHFDTTLGSPGGADCASCVGILLEQLRVLLHPGSAPPRAPIIFLLNGGEETFMQAAHGFVAHHPWAAEAGAVINVEATGTSGPDVLFRESGGWPAELYMKHAPRPVATATVRDLVRFANLPVDTDFSVFRDPTLEHGNLPGVDLASMLDGYSYHTDRDVVSRIRAGSIQAYGENVMRATEAFAAKLEKIETEGGDVARTRKGRVPTAPGQGGAFSTSSGSRGWSSGIAPVDVAFHFAPLLVCLGDAAAGGGSQTRAYLAGSKTAVKSLFFATVIPASLSAARAVVFGRPLAWFGNPALAGILTIPPAALAGVAPYVAAASRRRDVNAREESALGAALVSASLAAVCGVKRAALGYLWVFWSLGLSCVIHASRFFRFRGGGHVSSSFATSLFLAPASALASPVAYVTFALINEKVGISGSEPWPLGLVVGDLTMGVAAGACVALAGFGAFRSRGATENPPRVARRLGGVARLAAVATLRPTYAVATPKRLGVLHQHFEMDDFRFRGNVSSKRALDAEMLVGAFDAVPAANALAPLTARRDPPANQTRRFRIHAPGDPAPGRGRRAPRARGRHAAVGGPAAGAGGAPDAALSGGPRKKKCRARSGGGEPRGEPRGFGVAGRERRIARRRRDGKLGVFRSLRRRRRREIRRCEIHLQRDARERGFPHARARVVVRARARGRDGVVAVPDAARDAARRRGGDEKEKRPAVGAARGKRRRVARVAVLGGRPGRARGGRAGGAGVESVPGGGQRGDPGRHRRTRSGNLSHRGDDVPQRADATERRGTRRRVRCFFF